MHCVTLITRPGRAAAIVASVGLLFGVQGALTLRCPAPASGFGAGGYARTALLLVALAAAIAALGVLAPLHSRSGSIALWIARSGLALSLVAVAVALAAGNAVWAPLQIGGLCVAAAGMAWLVFARRHEGDLPGRLLESTLAATVLGVGLASLGGCLLPGICWLAVAAVLWSSYASPAGTRGTLTAGI